MFEFVPIAIWLLRAAAATMEGAGVTAGMQRTFT
jgi:hypothetical protein